jgi:amino acid transporter
MTPSPKPAEVQDDQELSRLGYAQELFRTMGGFSNFAISFSIISILTGAVTLYGYGLKMGGPAQMAWGWPLVAFFTMMVVMSMAELASSLPTSGAMYHWSAQLGGKGWGWLTAWLNIVGQIAAIAGIDYGCALFLTPLLGIASTTGNLLLVYGAILLSHALINHFGIRLVSWLNDFSVTVHIVGVVVIVGALLIFAPQRPVGFFFERVTSNTEGWSYGWAFILGLLQAMWTFTGYDASASVSEETIDPRRRAPWGMVLAVIVSAVVGYLLLFVLTLSIGDLPAVLSARDAGGNEVPAVIAVLTAALGERAGGLFSGLAAMAMWFCGLSAVTWSSRIIYAFARDGGLPGSGFWRRVNAEHRTPAPAIWLCVVLSFLAAVYSGAYAVITSISTIGLYLSYIIPVWLHWQARGTERQLEPGPWHLGRWSRLVNLLAMGWVVFLCIVLSIPDNFRTGKSILAVLAGLGFWYWLRERRHFTGPHWMESDSGKGSE